MGKFNNKLYNFMRGRYGADDLYKFCLIIYFILLVIDLFVKSNILTLLELLLLIFIFYRFFSKNTYKRRKENNKYLDIKNNIFGKGKQIKRRWNDRNTHIYKKCPKCKATLRLPLKKGVHTVKCPKCSNKFEVKCRRNEKVKVEVIRN